MEVSESYLELSPSVSKVPSGRKGDRKWLICLFLGEENREGGRGKREGRGRAWGERGERIGEGERDGEKERREERMLA